MRNKILLSVVGIAAAITLIVIWAEGVNATKPSENASDLTLKVIPEKPAYLLGEIVKLNFELTNSGDEPILLTYRPDVSTGYLKVWIASLGSDFNQYHNSSWERMEYGGPTLRPGQSFSSQATVLWNNKPQIPSLSENKILTDYAFPLAGVYLVKAVVTITGDVPIKVESEPIKITINEPVGDDLQVWNQIKESGEIASFVQRGSFLTSNNEEEQRLVKQVQEITQSYPNSFLVGQIRQKLERFRTGEERKREILEKARVKSRN